MKAYKVIKYIFDRLISTLLFIVLLPLFILVALIVAIDSRGPVIFRQKRVGKNQKPIYVFKFRTMKSVSIDFNKYDPVIEDDNLNLTRVGKIIRKLKIDELPQLLNVIIGQMSFVGPRPLMETYMSTYEEWELEKFNALPGLTGLAQVNGNGNLPTEERSYYDIMYTRKITLWQDIKIFFKTFLIIVCGEKKFIKNVDKLKLQELKDEYARNQKN